jgi:ribonuclease P protein component
VSSFTPTQRLVHKAQFDAVYQRASNKLGDSCFLILTRPNGLNMARLGLSVSARTVGNAVNRNRIKRVIRESFRSHAAALPAVDIVVNTRPGAREIPNAQLAERLLQHWQNLVKRCAAS